MLLSYIITPRISDNLLFSLALALPSLMIIGEACPLFCALLDGVGTHAYHPGRPVDPSPPPYIIHPLYHMRKPTLLKPVISMTCVFRPVWLPILK